MDVNIKGTVISSDEAGVYDYFGIENVTPKAVGEAVKKANGEKLDVYINSGGGDIFAGSEIYEALRSYKGDVKIHIVGFAASAASVIACARESEIAPTAMVMVHNVSSDASGDYHDMDKQSEILQKANQIIAAAYVEKTGMSESDALKMMDHETWLTAQDAVEKGLCNAISKPQQNSTVQLAASYNSGMLPKSVIDKMRNQLTNEKQKKQAQTKLNLLKLGGKNI